MSKFIGRDVVLFRMAGMDSNANLATIIGILGTWKTLEVNVTKNWADLTNSSADEPEKRRTTREWSATAKNFIDDGGSHAIGLAILDTDFLYCQFTDSNSGTQITLRGGIDKGSASFGQDAGEDTLEFSCKGKVGGLDSIEYLNV